MAKMGRPKSETPRTNYVSFRLTDEEYEKLSKYASNHNLTIAATMRRGIQLLLEKS